MYNFFSFCQLTVFQESPKGHLYLTSEVSDNKFCGGALVEITMCPQSGSCIGGMNHTTIQSDSEVHVARW